MATVNLLPSGSVSNNWTTSALGTAHNMMIQDHTGDIATDTYYLQATSTGKIFELEFDDFTEDFSSIDSVQAVVKAGDSSRGASFTLEMAISNPSGTFWAAESSGSQSASIGYRTLTFTSRTTSDGSSAWTNTDINNLRMKVELTAVSAGTVKATYCYFIVTYTEPVPADNAVFFGTNF